MRIYRSPYSITNSDVIFTIFLLSETGPSMTIRKLSYWVLTTCVCKTGANGDFFLKEFYYINLVSATEKWKFNNHFKSGFLGFLCNKIGLSNWCKKRHSSSWKTNALMPKKIETFTKSESVLKINLNANTAVQRSLVNPWIQLYIHPFAYSLSHKSS